MTKQQIAVFPFTTDSYESVYDLWQRCEGVGLGDSDSKEQIEIFLERNPGMCFLAKANKNLAGAVLCGHDGRRGYIHHLAVLPIYHRCGIGKLLVENCLKALQNSGILKCHIFIFHNNENGLRFWKSIGWSYRKGIGVVSKHINRLSQKP